MIFPITFSISWGCQTKSCVLACKIRQIPFQTWFKFLFLDWRWVHLHTFGSHIYLISPKNISKASSFTKGTENPSWKKFKMQFTVQQKLYIMWLLRKMCSAQSPYLWTYCIPGQTKALPPGTNRGFRWQHPAMNRKFKLLLVDCNMPSRLPSSFSSWTITEHFNGSKLHGLYTLSLSQRLFSDV